MAKRVGEKVNEEEDVPHFFQSMLTAMHYKIHLGIKLFIIKIYLILNVTYHSSVYSVLPMPFQIVRSTKFLVPLTLPS